MTDHLTEALKRCGKKSKASFNEIIPLLTNLSQEEFQIFLKRKPHVLGWSAFWHSGLLATRLRHLLESGFSNELLWNYFQSDENASTAITSLLWHHIPEGFTYFYKALRAFELSAHNNSLQSTIDRRDTYGKHLLAETRFIRENLELWKKDQIFYETIVKLTSIEELLIQVTSYYLRFKRSSQSLINNEKRMHDFRYNLQWVINRWLQVKKKQACTSEENIFEGYTPKTFSEKWLLKAPPESPPETVVQLKPGPDEELTQDKRLMRECIEFYLQQLRQEYHCDLFLSGHADFNYIDSGTGEAQLITNKQKELYDHNDRKSRFLENLTCAPTTGDAPVNTIEDLAKWWRDGKKESDNWYRWWLFHCLPSQVIANEKNIDMWKVLQLLSTFSQHLVPPGRNIFQLKDGSTHVKPNRVEDKKFRQLFPTEDHLLLLSRENTITGVKEYFDWNQEESENIVDFLTLDLTKPESPYPDVFERPFIRTPEGIIWLSAFYKSMAWYNTQANHLKAEQICDLTGDPYHLAQSSALESSTAQWFHDAGFTTAHSKKFTRQDEVGGEIDVVAMKDNVLYVIELKNSLRAVQFLQSHRKDFSRYSLEAAAQINDIETFIREEPERFKQVTGLTTNEQTKIVPLIAGVSFDSDDTLHGNDILKISVFELYVILTNQLQKLYNLIPGLPLSVLTSTMDGNNPAINPKSISEKKMEPLWEGSLSGNRLLDIIKKNEVWSPLRNEWRFVPEVTELKRFDKEERLMV